eukprot:6660322-Pyramimonas_sp.AAC.1
MANHKSKGRGVPVRFRRYFQPLFNMIVVDRAPLPDDDSESDDVQVLEDEDGDDDEDNAIQIPSSSDEDGGDRHDGLFSSADPDLQRLLSAHRTHLRTKTKKENCAYPYPNAELVPMGFDSYSGSDLAELTDVGMPVLDPKAFANLNAKLKAERIEKQTASKAMKAKSPVKAKSPMKATTAMKTKKSPKKRAQGDVAEAKRQHSLFYHQKLTECRRQGKSIDVCKEEARAAAKLGMAEWRATRAAASSA